MRQVLFRGKRYNGKWVIGSLFTYADGDCFICVEDYIVGVQNKYQVIPETVGEWTSQNDCNNEMIFEHDIVFMPDKEEIGIIQYDVDTSRFVIIYDGDICADFDNYWGKDLEIIGNIFDNAEYANQR